MRRLWILFCLVTWSVGVVFAQGGGSGGDAWWKHAVIYEIYPRSFQDTNGDGIGDIQGITQRLSYLRSLGIQAIWITPMYPSPQIDFGYDIADYEALDPMYGTMGDFDNLMKAAKQQGIRVIMDLVVNHTSDQNPWFLESRSSRDNPKRNWYIWRDGKDGGPPNNWESWFGGSAWQYDPKTKQYYYHYFYTQQPDLNWRNPEVRTAMYNVMRFWLDKGVSGFRMDAVSRLFEDPKLHDDPILPGKNDFGDPNIDHKYTDNLPEIHDVLKEMRKLVDSYPGHPVLISEADMPNIQELARMYGDRNDEVQLPMDFQIADVNQLSAPRFRKLFDEVENNPAHGWPEFFFSNHDQPRQWDRYGNGRDNDQIAKLVATLELTARATPQMYYGEEIGMRTTEPARVEDVKDPEGRTGWPRNKGRDGERTPMQWTPARPNAGFTWPTAKPWLPIPPSSVTCNVETQAKDPTSIYNFYKSLLSLRVTQPALISGAHATINPDDQSVFSYLRRYLGNGPSVLVALNMSDQPRMVTYDLTDQGIVSGIGLMLLNNYGYDQKTIRLDHMTIPPFGAAVISVK